MREHDDLDLLLPEAAPTAREQRRARRRPHRLRRYLTLLVALSLVAGAGYYAYSALRPAYDSLTASDDYSGAGTGKAEVVIPSGATGRAIGRVLEEAGVVKTAEAFVTAASANTRSASIQPGTYALRRQMSGSSAVTLLLDPKARLAERVTVREGLRAAEVVALLAKSTGQPPAAYAAALKKPAELGLPPQARGKVEGWLFPASYEFAPKATATEQLKAMVTQTKKVLASLKVPVADSQRVLIVASIAEVEAASPADYAKVARTVENRLAIGMRLQLDSTVSYAAGKRTITTSDAERAADSPYNTYVAPGLPEGPISNPGKAAMQGATRPAAGPWLFFVTVDPGTGLTKFAETKAEHDRNVEEFRAWCQANKGQC
ncbi:MAG TPA: endolytic transglycosylase MltG [Actinomycetales bacterium]|jgi:UPF0755 protein